MPYCHGRTYLKLKPSALNEVCVDVLFCLSGLGSVCLESKSVLDQGPTTTVTPVRFDPKRFLQFAPGRLFPANAWTVDVVRDGTRHARAKCPSVTEAADAATLNWLGEWYKAVGVTVTKPFLSGKSRHLSAPPRLAAGQSRPDRRGMEKLKSILSGRRRRATKIGLQLDRISASA